MPITLEHSYSAQVISILKPQDRTCHLRLYITTDWNTKPMERHLWQKATLYTAAFHRTPMNCHEVGILCCLCFLPALTYLLQATWLLDAFFDKVHQLSMSTILNKMRYHCNLPRSVVFVPQSMGSVGLCNLQYEMEVQQIMILLWHMWSKTPLSNTMEILLWQYQQSILVNTHPCPWVPNYWMSRLWQTINTYNITVCHEAWTVPPLRQYDIYIMEAIKELGLTLSQLEQINMCRMFLQITTAEMNQAPSPSLESHKPRWPPRSW